MKNERMSLSDDQKAQVLMRALDERYKAMHVVRERAQSVAIWSLGTLLVASGWMVQKEASFDLNVRIVITILVFAAFYVLKEHYIRDLDKTFQSQHRVAVRIERTLGLYDRGVFSEESMYPEVWMTDSADKKQRGFFFANYRLLYVGVFIFLAVLWLGYLMTAN